MANRWGNSGNSDRLYFGGPLNHCRWWLQPWNKKTLTPWKESYDQPRQHIKKQRPYFANKGPSSQSYGFSTSRVWMWELDYKESWVPKNWCFWRRLLRVPCTARKSNQSILKETVLNIHRKDWCWNWDSNTLATWYKELTHWKRLWCWESLKAGGEGDNRGWDGWMASRWTWVWISSGSWWWTGNLVCCSPWSRKELDTTEWLNWTEQYLCI